MILTRAGPGKEERRFVAKCRRCFRNSSIMYLCKIRNDKWWSYLAEWHDTRCTGHWCVASVRGNAFPLMEKPHKTARRLNSSKQKFSWNSGPWRSCPNYDIYILILAMGPVEDGQKWGSHCSNLSKRPWFVLQPSLLKCRPGLNPWRSNKSAREA